MIYKNVSKVIAFDVINTDGSVNTTTSPTVEVAQDSGNFAASTNSATRKTTTGSAATNIFHITLTAAEMNADCVAVRITAAGCVPRFFMFFPESDFSSAKITRLDSIPEAIVDAVTDTSPSASSFKGSTALSSAADNFYGDTTKGVYCVFRSGNLKGLSRHVSGYTAATRLLQFTNAFPQAPANGDAFILIGAYE